MSKTILIVDDDANNRTVLNDIFTEIGYKVIEASGAEEAIEKTLKESPYLILIDTILTDNSDGIELCRRIKQVEKIDTKVLIYTGKIDAIDAVRAREAGADEYCIKGGNPALLIDTVKMLIQDARYNR